MKNLLWLTPIALSSILMLAGCDGNKQEDRAPGLASAPSTPSASTAPAGKMSDVDLEKAVRARLESDDALKQANLSVSAAAADNKVTISGSVVSQEMRERAIDLAKRAQPGVAIEDKIDVKPAA